VIVQKERAGDEAGCATAGRLAWHMGLQTNGVQLHGQVQLQLLVSLSSLIHSHSASPLALTF
jgi:hypothetical protein